MGWITAALLALFVYLLPACSVLKMGRAPGLPERARGDLMEALVQQGGRLTGLKARGSLQLTIRGEAQPRVKGVLRWARAQDGLRLRLTGIGPVGSTVFDCLADGKAVYLYIPSRNTAYSEGYGDSTWQDGGLEAIAQAAIWLLDPWSTALIRGARLTSCPPSLSTPGGGRVHLACLQFPAPSSHGFVGIEPATLAATILVLPKVTAHYSDYRVLEDGSLYPGRLTVTTSRPELEVVMDLGQIEPNTLLATDPAFDAAPFRRLPSLPLDALFPEGAPYATDPA